MSSKYHLILMRIKCTKYKTSTSFLFTLTFILFIEHKFNIRSQFASNGRVLKPVCFIDCWKAMTGFFFSQPRQKTEESSKYQYQRLINES